MHTLQILLIEAEGPLEAFRIVEDSLNEGKPHWSDWHNASNAHSMNFAGRWSGAALLTPEQEADTTLDYSSFPNYLCYDDNQELADQVIQKHLGWRRQAMRENLPVGMPDLSTLIEGYDSNNASNSFGEASMGLWKLKKVLELLNEDWTYESFIYDLETWTASLHYFIERCAKNPQDQYLIPVDFHH